MKEIFPNYFKLETIEERKDFFENVWHTKMFKDASRNEKSLVGGLLKKYIKYPRYYYNIQNKDLERAAFTSWYNVLSLKDYDNKYIHDLYLLHELTHICSMPYREDFSFGEWQAKMRENEVWASLVSEVFIYFELPELRNHSFGKEIWVDRFLKHPDFENKSVGELYSLILPLRQKCYIQPRDKVEKELAEFKKFSFLFYDVWQRDYSLIEKNILNLKKGNVEGYELFLKNNMGPSNILFEDKIKEHFENYVRLNNLKPHY